MIPGTQEDKPKEESRALRGQYAHIDKGLDRDRDQIVNAAVAEDGSDRLAQDLKRAEDLRKKVSTTREMAYDTRVFAKLIGVAVDRTRVVLQGATDRSASHLVAQLTARFVEGNPDPDDDGFIPRGSMDWERLGDEVSHLFRPTLGVGGLLGPLSLAPQAAKPKKEAVKRVKAEVVGQRRDRAAGAAPVRPEELVELDRSEKQDTPQNMVEVHKILKSRKKEGKVTLVMDLILNWTSFAQTLENLFALSFLIRDGEVGIKESPEGLIAEVISKKDKEQQQQQQQAGAPPGVRTAPNETRATQCVFSMGMKDWEELKKHSAPERCLMPHRDPYSGVAAAINAAPALAARRGGAGGASGQKRYREDSDDDEVFTDDEEDRDARRDAAAQAAAAPRAAPAAAAAAAAAKGVPGKGLPAADDEDEDGGSPPEEVKRMDAGAGRRVGSVSRHRPALASPSKTARYGPAAAAAAAAAHPLEDEW